MNTEQPVKRDERTVAVQNAAFKWGYYSVYLGILLDCLYRRKVRNEDIGDLFVVLGVSIAVVIVYRIRHKAIVPLVPWRTYDIPLVVCIVVVLAFAFLPGFVALLLSLFP